MIIYEVNSFDHCLAHEVVDVETKIIEAWDAEHREKNTNALKV
jgi:hypothetical protein